MKQKKCSIYPTEHIETVHCKSTFETVVSQAAKAGDLKQNPDSTSHSFIGFTGESPTISYQSFEGYSQLAYLFIEWFYYYSVYSSYNVHDALNLASQAVFGVSYNSSPLTSYNAWWPGGDGIPAGWFAGQMKIYGDAAIMIKQ